MKNAKYLAFARALATESQRRRRESLSRDQLDPAINGDSLGSVLNELLDGIRDSSWLDEFLADYVAQTKGEVARAADAPTYDDLIEYTKRQIKLMITAQRSVDASHFTDTLEKLLKIRSYK